MSAERKEQQPVSPVAGCLARIVWMMGGLFGSFMTAVAIWRYGKSSLSWLDGFYWGILLLALAARYAEIVWFEPVAAADRKALLASLARALLVFVPVAVAVWGAAHFLAS